MGLETGTNIGDLNQNWPLGSDAKSQGDDHIRLVKTVLKNTFPAPYDNQTIGEIIDSAVVTVGNTFPVSAVDGEQHYLTTEPAGLYIYINDGTSEQWVQCNGSQKPTASVVYDPTQSYRIIDNTLECWGVVTGVTSGTNPTVNLLKTFAAAPVVTLSASVEGDVWVSSVSTTQVGLDTANSSTPQDIRWHAIGEWDGIS